MTFKEIIITAVEEMGGKDPSTGSIGVLWNWKWCDTELDAYFTGQRHCNFYWCGVFLFNINETDLLDPDWSPDVLAKRINDRIAEACENEFGRCHSRDDEL